MCRLGYAVENERKKIADVLDKWDARMLGGDNDGSCWKQPLVELYINLVLLK